MLLKTGWTPSLLSSCLFPFIRHSPSFLHIQETTQHTSLLLSPTTSPDFASLKTSTFCHIPHNSPHHKTSPDYFACSTNTSHRALTRAREPYRTQTFSSCSPCVPASAGPQRAGRHHAVTQARTQAGSHGGFLSLALRVVLASVMACNCSARVLGGQGSQRRRGKAAAGSCMGEGETDWQRNRNKR